MNKLANIIDREMMEQDRRRLMAFEKDIKEASENNYDDLHMEFVCKNEDLNFGELLTIKKVFDFLKNRA